MKLKKLRLTNFRNHEDTTLDCAGASLVFVLGKNYSGKSSLRQALSMCLTPSTIGLDAQGRGYAAKIKRGASKAEIAAVIQGSRHQVERSVVLNTNQSGRTPRTISLSDPDWNPAPFDRQMEAARGALAVALNTEAFLRLDEKEQKNLLASLALPRRYAFDGEVAEAVKRLLGDAINFEDEPFAVIQRAYKALYDERQIVNRQVKEFILPEGIPVPAGVDAAMLQERLTDLRLARRERLQVRDGAVMEASRQQAERDQRQAKMQSLLPEDRLASLRSVAAGKKELGKLNQEKKQIEANLDFLLRHAARLKELPEAGTPCPTCEQIMDAPRRAALAAKVGADIEEAKERHLAIHQKIKALGDIDGAAKLLAAHDQAARELIATEEPQPVLFDFAPYNQSLAECDAEIETLSAQLRPVIAAEERWKEILVKRQQLEKLTEKAALLDRLVKYFDKDGIKAKLLGEYIGGFEQKINEVLSPWGYGCALSIEPYTFMVTNARGDAIPVRELSGAEGVMFSAALQCAVSWTANIGLVVIDEVGMLLPELRPALYERLHDMIGQGYLEQVLLLVADSEPVPVLPGAACFRVDEGRLSRMESEELLCR